MSDGEAFARTCGLGLQQHVKESMRRGHVRDCFEHSSCRVTRNERRQIWHAVVRGAKYTARCSLWRNVRVFGQE